MRPGILTRLLVGEGSEALARRGNRFIASNGAVDDALYHTLHGKPDTKLKELLYNLKGSLIGYYNPVETLKQRYIQGGVAGKGGILHGSVAIAPQLRNAIRERGLAKAVLKHPMLALSGGLNAGMMTAIPGYAAYKSYERGDPGAVGRAVGEGLGWTVSAPFGFIGGPFLAARAGDVGEMLARPRMPQLQTAHPDGLAPPQVATLNDVNLNEQYQ